MQVKGKGVFSGVQFEIRNVTPLLVKGMDNQNTKTSENASTMLWLKNMRQTSNNLCSVSRWSHRRAVMARVANLSSSRGMHAPDESWMGCIAHQLNKASKNCFATFMEGTVSHVFVQDFRGVKRTVVDARRCGCNHLLTRGKKLVQELEKNLDPFVMSQKKFLEACHYNCSLLDSLMGLFAEEACKDLKNIEYWWWDLNKISVNRGWVWWFLCSGRFHWPFWNITAPNVACCVSHDPPHARRTIYGLVYDNKKWRGEGQALAFPSIYSAEFCWVLCEKILSHAWDHPPLIAW